MAAVAVTGPGVVFAQWAGPNPSTPRQASPLAVSTFCSAFPGTISTTTTAAAGVTNGEVGTPAVGETYTISIAGPGSGTFRMVGDAGGLVTYAGPASVPASLNYTVTSATLPAGAQGVGYYFDSGTGTVTITATCSAAAAVATPVPATEPFALWLLALLLLIGGTWLTRARRGKLGRPA
ncbi:MAG: hypothetical protein L0H70_07700 [Xanthomonadales bacterium]|nr:hypothetical protein [Xanthomonadales bacterium]